MLLSALVLAAAASAATPDVPSIPPNPVPSIEQRGPDVWPLPKQAAPMPNFGRQPARCGPAHRGVVDHIRTATKGRTAATYAVMRKVDGCMVLAPMGYRQDYLLPGAADPKR